MINSGKGGTLGGIGKMMVVGGRWRFKLFVPGESKMLRTALLVAALLSSSAVYAQVSVRGHYRDGVYIPRHTRTAPDGYRWNNRSKWYPVQRYYQPYPPVQYQLDQLRRQQLNQQQDAQMFYSDPYLYRPMRPMSSEQLMQDWDW